jgi:hypothetical protein
MADTRLPSLDLVLEEVRREREAQLRHFDALDAKAGVVLGFAGLVTIAAPQLNALLTIARLTAAASALSALLAFWPRRYWSTDVRKLRNLYLRAEPRFTELKLTDTMIGMVESIGRRLSQKAQRLKFSMTLLAVGAVFASAGLVIN